ncbi:MAG: hypothetical protein M1410_06180 [Candidatus Thermoplasmatota archaeon]|nr:hypothetical protein [Candidatus Thermoplasmatota archaeon]
MERGDATIMLYRGFRAKSTQINKISEKGLGYYWFDNKSMKKDIWEVVEHFKALSLVMSNHKIAQILKQAEEPERVQIWATPSLLNAKSYAFGPEIIGLILAEIARVSESNFLRIGMLKYFKESVDDALLPSPYDLRNEIINKYLEIKYGKPYVVGFLADRKKTPVSNNIPIGKFISYKRITLCEAVKESRQEINSMIRQEIAQHYADPRYKMILQDSVGDSLFDRDKFSEFLKRQGFGDPARIVDVKKTKKITWDDVES